MLEANDKKKTSMPYRQALEKLPLIKVYARVKYRQPDLLKKPKFAALLKALQGEDVAEAEKNGVEFIDFDGNVVKQDKLQKDAKALEDKVTADVGRDNKRIQSPPLY